MADPRRATGGVPTRMAEWLDPWASDRHPTDIEKAHTEEIRHGDQVYSVEMGGTMDGENCRTPQGSWDPMIRTWESNRTVTIENIGDSDVIDPWLSNGRNDFRSIEEIVNGVLRPGMTDREKALALYNLEISERFHAHSGDREGTDPVKVYNIYGFTTCGHDAACLAGLWRQAGFERRPGRAMGHVITQVRYDGAWHLMDGDMQCLYLLRDNHTVADVGTIARDHDLVKRTHAEGLLRRDDRAGNEWEASLFVYEGEAGGTRDSGGFHTMSMTLRPGEALTWRWGQLEPVKYHGRDDIAASFGADHERTICNGLWRYSPRLDGDLLAAGADSVSGVVAGDEGGVTTAGSPGSIVWRMRSPYVFVGGRVELEGWGCAVSLSWDGIEWLDPADELGLDELFPRQGPPRYEYYLRCTLEPGGRLSVIHIVNDVQMAPLALPGMTVGTSSFRYTDACPEARRVRITHEWVERSATAAPTPPEAPVYPSRGQEIEGTDLAFEWLEPGDARGGFVVDYHFELSEYEDMRWPLSSNFRKLISLTADAGTGRYTLPLPGLLAPDREYFWRVRAQNDAGVWGPWSNTWRFTAKAPVPPIAVRMDFDGDRGIGTLRWKAGSGGRKPAVYRVYGSDEKGFSVSDEPYAVMDIYAGDWRKARLGGRFEANFVGETEAMEMVVVRRELSMPNANRAFYRVVAVDENGNRSWSSDFVEAPRPFFRSDPVVSARVGCEYRYLLDTVRSLGDLRYRPVSREQVPEFWPPKEHEEILSGPPWNLQVANFWDVQTPHYVLESGPDWLELDGPGGVLWGIPESSGTYDVAVSVTVSREAEELDPEALTHGRRVVLGVRTEVEGPARQRFTIRVDP